MKRIRDYRLYIKDILDSVERIREYTKDLSFVEFRKKKIVIDAVVRNFEIIGEAAKSIPEDIKSCHKEIPWKEMSGMRNKMIHEYFGVDIDIVWKTISNLSDLKSRLSPLIK